jgi:hypothetical protein
MEPSDFSQDFLLIFDLNQSKTLELNELENAHNGTLFGKALDRCASLDIQPALAQQLWYYVFEKGAYPQSPLEKAAFINEYSQQDHSALTVNLKQVDRALSLLQNSCMRRLQ